MATPIIEVRNISKRYRLGKFGAGSLRESLEETWQNIKNIGRRGSLNGEANKAKAHEFWALNDVSFEVEPGAVVGIIGRNGAGKSTLLRILSRITEPTSGDAILRGRVASLLEVGTGFHPELSGRENIFLNGAILGLKHAEIASRFDEIVAFSEVDKFIDTPVKRYSSGMYVRLAFAVAAHLEPEILIVDEVLAVGDQSFQQKCIGKMQDVAQNSGRTVLFVSHHMSSIRRLCRQCLVLSRGESSQLLDVERAVETYNAYYRAARSDYAIDTSTLKREDGRGTDVRIVEIKAVGEPPLIYGGKLRIEFTLESKIYAKDVMVGIAFNSMEGARTMTIDSDAGGVFFNLEPGTNRVAVEVDSLPLHPAQYTVHAGVGSGQHYYDLCVNFGVWEVFTSERDLVSDRGFGGCRLIPATSHEVLTQRLS